MTRADARVTLLRKFTNDRRQRLSNTGDDGSPDNHGHVAAAALFDFKNYSKGKSLFKSRHEKQIRERKLQLLKENSALGSIGAYQRAVKELWAAEDEQYWEREAETGRDDIFEYGFLLLL